MKKNNLSAILALGALLALPAAAPAHILFGVPHGFHDGVSHPLTGLDHLLAMVATGLWAAQQRGRALWLIPFSFVGVMILGGALGFSGAVVPGADLVIALSVLVLGLLVATSARFKPALGMMVAGGFAFFHGWAHGHEMPASVSAPAFAAGFVLSTLALIGAGLAAGLMLERRRRVLACAGSIIAVCSVYFITH